MFLKKPSSLPRLRLSTTNCSSTHLTVPKTVFIADLHLDKQYPDALSAFLNYLSDLTKQPVDSLYILGDLFEYWLGDDCIDKTAQSVATALTSLANSKTDIYFIHGNRDFLLNKSFANQCKMTLLPEHHVINLYGVKTLIMHGDTLCTEDSDYMQFRQMVRQPEWQKKVLRLPVWLRRLKAQHMRYRSKQSNQKKTQSIMDVTQSTVEDMVQQYHVTQLIHGHTHRPNVHNFQLNGENISRYVLGDWYEQGSILEFTPDGGKLISFSFN